MTKTSKNFTAEKNLYCSILIKIAIYLSLASIKDAQAKGEAFSPQKRTSNTSKYDFFLLFSIFLG
jgi:hypothetical protein